MFLYYLYPQCPLEIYLFFQHFESQIGKLAYATVATKKDNTDPTKRLSMGYGFVRFIKKQDADKALKTLQQTILDGKSLELKRSERILKLDDKLYSVICSLFFIFIF